MGNSITCHVNHPFFGSPISLYPYTGLGPAGDVGSHAAASNDNPAGASGANAEVEKRLGGAFYRRLGRGQRDREKPERLLSVGTTRTGQLSHDQSRFSGTKGGGGGVAVRGIGGRLPQQRNERQNFAECGELLRNASVLMTT